MRSRRRGSVSITSGSAGSSRLASGRRAAVTVRTSRPRSTGSRAIRSARASNRDTSIRSSTSVRSRPTSATSSSPARRLSWRQRAEVLAHDRRLGDERGERGPQLVRDVGHEAPVLGLGGLEPGDRVGQRLGHPVEAVRPRPELVVRGDRHAGRQVAALDPLRSPAGGLDRGQDAAGDDPRDEQGDHDEDERPDHERQSELRECLLELGRVVDEVERRPSGTDPATDHEARLAGDRRPGVGQLARRDAVAQVGRERRERRLEPLARDGHAVRSEVDDRVDAALVERVEQAAVGDVVLGRARRQVGGRDDDRQVEARLGLRRRAGPVRAGRSRRRGRRRSRAGSRSARRARRA